MTQKTLIRILESHGIEFYKNEDQIFSIEDNSNLSEMTLTELKIWLGYDLTENEEN